jgi:hypothetical protein
MTVAGLRAAENVRLERVHSSYRGHLAIVTGGSRIPG